jgi:hypothetical protein
MVKYTSHEGSTDVEFDVGPFTYVMNFAPDDENGRVIRVEFKLADINVTDDELMVMMSKVRRQEIEEKGSKSPEDEEILEGRLISLQEAKTMEREILYYHPYSELEITGSYVIKIFGVVLNTLKSYVAKRRPRCVVFSADSKERKSVYDRLIRRAFPQASIKEYPSPWGTGVEIKVCFT